MFMWMLQHSYRLHTKLVLHKSLSMMINGLSSCYAINTIFVFIYCCGSRDCDLGGDLPIIFGFGYEDYLISSFCNSNINSSCDAYGLFGSKTSISSLACNYIMGASGSDLFFLFLP
jgi:hypothetical protein